MEQIRKFTEEFFRNLKCDVVEENGILVVENVPRSFEDLFGRAGPYNLIFSNRKSEMSVSRKSIELVGKGSCMLIAITKYLEGTGKATILRIDFSSSGDLGESDLDVEAEVMKRLALRNCRLDSLTKGYKNNFFSRFSFISSFNYLNESDRLLSEIYVHNGEVVDGDLNGYTVVDGEKLTVDSEKIKKDYGIAKIRAAELSKGKQEGLSNILKEKVEAEVVRIKEHYDKQLGELGGDLNEKLGRIREMELELRSCSDEDRAGVRKKLERLRGGLVKAGDDEIMERVLREREMTIGDVMQKFSLNVERKLVNTTVIYYPVYSFKLHLKEAGVSDSKSRSAEKLVDVVYDPLTKKFSGLDCESCKVSLERVSLCGSGHICCENCLDRCGECGGVFCVKCLKRRCKACGRKLCRDCVKMCLGCGGIVCATHLRRDCVSGEERCVSCLRACLRCHGMCEEKFFGEALDGSKVCQKCLGKERSGKVLERVFVR